MRVFSNRSQMTSKCGENREVAHEPQASESHVFFHILTSSVVYYWKDPCEHKIYSFFTINRKGKRQTYLVLLVCSRICARLSIFQVITLLHCFFFFLYLTCIQFLRVRISTPSLAQSTIIAKTCESLVEMTHDGNCCVVVVEGKQLKCGGGGGILLHY